MNIDKLQIGLELDIRMANIMGWQEVSPDNTETEPATMELKYVYCIADFDYFDLGKPLSDAVYYRHVCDDKFRPFWPSACIESAWWLVEKFGMQCGHAIQDRSPFAMREGDAVEAESVPMAICKMALMIEAQ